MKRGRRWLRVPRAIVVGAACRKNVGNCSSVACRFGRTRHPLRRAGEFILLRPDLAIVRVDDSVPDYVAGPANCATATVAGALRIAGDSIYEADCVLCVEDAPRGRPAPFLIFEAAKRLDVYPTWSMIKVDDTPVGIEAGRNAGCWTVGITRTGNCVGLSATELAARSAAEVADLCAMAEERLRAAGSHFILASAADLPLLVREIDEHGARRTSHRALLAKR